MYNEFKRLNKDLNFRPTAEKYNKSKCTKDINNFMRRIKLKAHFKTTKPLSKKDIIQLLRVLLEKSGS